MTPEQHDALDTEIIGLQLKIEEARLAMNASDAEDAGDWLDQSQTAMNNARANLAMARYVLATPGRA